MKMKKIGLLILAVTLFMACSKNLVTGRKQLKLVSETELQSMADTEYQTFLKSNNVVSSSDNQAAMVRRVGSRIATAIKKYYDGKGQTSVLAGYNWEFNLVDSKEINAWCMPGGKVVVYIGILPITQTEAGLAIVLGHEIAHAVAQHGSERMSQGLVQQLGGSALQTTRFGQ
jgi:predicted Zn-dependent protease